MALKDKEAARRFITLIDELYNKKYKKNEKRGGSFPLFVDKSNNRKYLTNEMGLALSYFGLTSSFSSYTFHSCRLICSADADPDELFTGNKSSVSFSQLQQQDCELTAQGFISS